MMTNDDRLTRAIVTGNLADVRLCVRSAQDAAKRQNGTTAIELAVEHMQPDVVRYLLTVGADPNTRDPVDGRTPLHRAVDVECADAKHREDTDGVAYAPEPTLTLILLEHGGNPWITAEDGTTPFDSARRQNHTEATQLFRTRADGRLPHPHDQHRCLELVRAILRGDVDLIETGIQLVAALHTAKLDRVPEVHSLIAFDSDADAFPRAHARGLWDPNALAENDRKREQYIAHWRPYVLDACRALEARLSGELRK